MLGGVIPTSELVGQSKAKAALISTSLCDGSALQTIIDAIRAASDIMQDGTQDPTKVCDGISIGYAFEVKPVQLGAVKDKQAPLPDPCQ